MNTQEIKQIRLHQIILNSNNPRKSYSHETLSELADNIKAQGVIQPIMVHKRSDYVDEDVYEIIYGERRCRASKLAGCDTIPAIVLENLTQTQILEIALVENLQREDISPIDEMLAYQQFIEQSGYKIENLCEKFGKSDGYIRSRLRLSNLIEEYHTLLHTEEISIGVALELCKYSKEIQAEVYDSHFAEGVNYQNWRGNSTKSIAESLERSYSTDLEDYLFDKEECYNCSFNTQVISLFADDTLCGRCTNRSCLKARNTAYIVERAIETRESNPELPLARYDYRFDECAIEELTTKGYEVEIVDWCRECPTPPNAEDCESAEEYQDELMQYTAESDEISNKYHRGEVEMYALIGTRGVTLSYRSSSSSSTSEPETPLVKLQNQDKRNGEIAIEKIVADTKDLVKGLDVRQGDFSVLEVQITYFAMAKALRSEHFELVGIDPDKHYLTDCDRWHLVQNLTEEQRVIIKRDFIINTFVDAQRGNYTAVMLTEYAKQHAPDKHDEIQATHKEVYEKRHERIIEKIEALK